ncbi:hypothetical protein HOB10_03910 [Candidatus Parcubacteria bacterium]|jgi:hypothetical protein|nr:hypothetical protein [Candidatus Parcubacteria bacterium]
MQKSPKVTNFWHGVKKYNTPIVFFIILFWTMMLVSSNYANSQNLERNDLTKNIRVIEDEIRLLNTTVGELQTTERLENESQRLDLVKIQTKDIYYIDQTNEKVALK